MSDIKTLTEKLNRTFEQFKEQNDKAIEEADKRHGEATAETREQVEKINTELTELRKQITEFEKRAARPKDGMTGPEGDEKAEVRKRAFDKYLRYGIGETGRAMFSDDEHREIRALSDADGGFLIPVEFDNMIIMQAYDLAELRPVCNVAPTGRDVVQLGSLSKPTVAWGRANIAISTQTLTAGAERIEIFDLKALVLLANNMLEDAQADVIGEVTAAFSRAIAEAEDDAFAAGAGDDSPQGVAANSGVQANYVASGVAAALSDSSNNGVDALIGCMYTPAKIYRRNGTWAMNSTTESVVRKLKDGEGNYLWQPNTQAGTPATLIGRPIINPEGLADIGANAFPIIFGDFNAGYKIRDRAGLSVQRLVERYAEYDQTGLLVKKRTGGKVVLAEAFSCVKIAAS